MHTETETNEEGRLVVQDTNPGANLEQSLIPWSTMPWAMPYPHPICREAPTMAEKGSTPDVQRPEIWEKRPELSI